MEVRHHNKLVRDDIILELTQKGIEYTATKLAGAELHNALVNKLFEEVGEVKVAFATNHNELLEELADVVEVCYAIAKHVCNDAHGYEVDLAKLRKASRKGRFNNGDFLLTTKGGR